MIGNTFVISQNPGVVNDIINHADVRPYVGIPGGPDGYLDTTELFKQGAVSLLTPNKDGGALFVFNGDEAEGHSFALKTARGKAMLRACVDGIYFLLKSGACNRVYGHTPIANKAAMSFSRRIGFRPVGVIELDRGCGILETVMKFERLSEWV